MLNRLTPLYFEIYYKEKKHLKVRTVVFKYITPPYSKGLVYRVYNRFIDLQILYSKLNYMTQLPLIL